MFLRTNQKNIHTFWLKKVPLISSIMIVLYSLHKASTDADISPFLVMYRIRVWIIDTVTFTPLRQLQQMTHFLIDDIFLIFPRK